MDESTNIATVLTAGNGQADIEDTTEPTKTLRFNVTEERMKGLKVGVLRKANAQDVGGLLDFVAHFAVDENGRYLDSDLAYELLDDLTLEQLEETTLKLNEAMEDAAVPKG
jgi:hypothetical protein